MSMMQELGYNGADAAGIKAAADNACAQIDELLK